jgi:formate hydrogenlyase subunit 3/multisubunit Na+/H+ antiporter MnhD subunit
MFTSGVIACIFGRHPRKSSFIGAGGAVIGSITGLTAAIRTIFNDVTIYKKGICAFNIGALSTGIDQLSAFFLAPLFVLVAASSIYAVQYLKPFYAKKNIGLFWLFFNLLASSIATLVITRNGVFFLVAWEIMSVSSYFLVTFEDEHKSVRQAGIIYLISSHIGVMFLFFLFVMMGNACGSMEFADFSSGLSNLLPVSSIIFTLAVIGFGVKAGFVPFHFWLPQAHPAAPSPVSALMSAVMIKTGIYGLLRILMFIGPPRLWWGIALLGIGLISGILGVLFALAQHDVKRLLAYHSVENIGIIAIGIGLGLIGLNKELPILALFGFAGSLLHIINHALFKGLLFLGAGAVVQQTGTRNIELLGGVFKKMPVTGITFLIGAAAISGLPPLNGFASEFLIYFGSFSCITDSSLTPAISSLLAITGLALIGALAVACFTKVFSIVFLGHARSAAAEKASEPGKMMQSSMVFLAVLCILIGISMPLIIPGFRGLLAEVSGLASSEINLFLGQAKTTFVFINKIYLVLAVVFVFLLLLRKKMLAKKPVRTAPTWDCGYNQPSPKMQYTGSSFAQPITDFFNFILRADKKAELPSDTFPKKISMHTESNDIFMRYIYEPLSAKIYSLIMKLRWIQHGRLQVYILYIVVTLLILIIWKLG